MNIYYLIFYVETVLICHWNAEKVYYQTLFLTALHIQVINTIDYRSFKIRNIIIYS